MSAVEISNLAIGLVGGNKIASLDDESVEAVECKLYYDLARTFCLENRDWTFASVTKLLAQDSTAVSTEFANSYTLPAKCLVVREVASSADLKSKEIYQLSGRSIVTDSGTVYLKYTENVEDTSKFSPSFTIATAHKLAELIASQVTGDKSLKRTLNAEAEEAMETGGAINGMQGSPKRAYASRLVNARFRIGGNYGLGSTL
jgi:hypothetical protein